MGSRYINVGYRTVICPSHAITIASATVVALLGQSRGDLQYLRVAWGTLRVLGPRAHLQVISLFLPYNSQQWILKAKILKANPNPQGEAILRLRRMRYLQVMQQLQLMRSRRQ